MSLNSSTEPPENCVNGYPYQISPKINMRERNGINSSSVQKFVAPAKMAAEEMDSNHRTDLKATQEIALDLAFDIVHYFTDSVKDEPVNIYAKTLRRTVDEISERHKILFTNMAEKLNIANEDNGYRTFKNVADEVFHDGNYNWGRIVSIYAFAGHVAKFFADHDKRPVINNVAAFVGNYIAENLAGWIHKTGGWEAFETYFPEQKNLEDRLWKGLLFTAFGLGALATMVAVR